MSSLFESRFWQGKSLPETLNAGEGIDPDDLRNGVKAIVENQMGQARKAGRTEEELEGLRDDLQMAGNFLGTRFSGSTRITRGDVECALRAGTGIIPDFLTTRLVDMFDLNGPSCEEREVEPNCARQFGVSPYEDDLGIFPYDIRAREGKRTRASCQDMLDLNGPSREELEVEPNCARQSGVSQPSDDDLGIFPYDIRAREGKRTRARLSSCMI